MKSNDDSMCVFLKLSSSILASKTLMLLPLYCRAAHRKHKPLGRYETITLPYEGFLVLMQVFEMKCGIEPLDAER